MDVMNREQGIARRDELLKELTYERDKLVALLSRREKMLKKINEDIDTCGDNIIRISGEIELIDNYFTDDFYYQITGNIDDLL